MNTALSRPGSRGPQNAGDRAAGALGMERNQPSRAHPSTGAEPGEMSSLNGTICSVEKMEFVEYKGDTSKLTEQLVRWEIPLPRLLLRVHVGSQAAGCGAQETAEPLGAEQFPARARRIQVERLGRRARPGHGTHQLAQAHPGAGTEPGEIDRRACQAVRRHAGGTRPASIKIRKSLLAVLPRWLSRPSR